MIWIGPTALICATLLFLLFYLRLRHHRFVHEIYMHSFMLLSLSYLLMYVECALGVIASCFIFLEEVSMSRISMYVFNIALFSFCSANSAAKFLREYRIYISTQIELGSMGYKKTIMRKERLKNRWNILIILSYTVFMALATTVSVIIYRNYYDGDQTFIFFGYFLVIVKIFESFIQIYSFFKFMNKTVDFGYRFESVILILFQYAIVVIVLFVGYENFIKFGMLSILKICNVVIFDSYILCVLMKEGSKKPLLPPIFMIDSSFYVTEIKLVYEFFLKFINKEGNKEWKALLDMLMEIQINKLDNPRITEESGSNYVKKLQSFDLIVYDNVLKGGSTSEDDSLCRHEIHIIESLDNDAFRKFMKSKEYQEFLTKFQSCTEFRLEVR